VNLFWDKDIPQCKDNWDFELPVDSLGLSDGSVTSRCVVRSRPALRVVADMAFQCGEAGGDVKKGCGR
jgi:hypothetical protein